MAFGNSERSSLLESPVTSTNETLHKSNRNVYFTPKPIFISRDSRTNSAPLAISSSSLSPGPSVRFSVNNRFKRYENTDLNNNDSVTISPNTSKIAPQRTTKNTQKLKLLPNPDFGDEGQDDENGREVYSQHTRIKDPNARRDATRLGKADRDRLPRVTAYCTASKYQIENVMRFLKGRGKTRGAKPKLVDECVYTPYSYNSYEKLYEPPRKKSGSIHSQGMEYVDSASGVDNLQQTQRKVSINVQTGIGNTTNHSKNSNHIKNVENIIDDGQMTSENNLNLETQAYTPEIFIFEYGVVVIWGMSPQHEQQFLKEIARFENEKLDPDDIETECFNFYYTQEYQPQIYNDFISLRDKGAYMTKLAISHALAQSVKTSLFEELVDNTIETCKDIPGQIANTGKISLSRTQINMQIGELFILRINIHLNGSILDTPEIFWLEPHLEPVYQAVRSYLEIDQRVSLLTERLDVIADLLAVLKDQLSHRHGEMLEWIVIVLIGAEILVAAINIIVDLYADIK
ncbi:Sad1-interacting factor 2 [Erysiphe necator]|uniref:Putative sporulation protein rmd1 n=1 Tax=Uncinula necator TaxID=52586 RepID=A0A0B1PDW5_UNCNE|nr:Sad1-interacting factor 2 [Erysiphe necator]KHJ35550.1 putative sporulation protein rmd1 [Erysiphe necator]